MSNSKENKTIIKIRYSIIWFIDLFYKPFKKWMPIQTFQYAVCGGSATVLGLVIYFIAYNFILDKEIVLVFGFPMTKYIAAYAISFCFSFPVSFFLSKFVVFSDSHLKGRVQWFRFGVLQIVNIFINWSLLHLFAGYLGFWATPSQMMTTAIMVVISYFFQRNISFRTKKEPIDQRSTLDNNKLAL